MVKKIPLTRGKVALVDDEWYDYLSQFSWYATKKGYAIATIKGRNIRMHRLILDVPDGMQVDHINGNKADNRLENLRVCTHGQNVRNVGRRKDNTSGYKGVIRASKSDAWEANIKYRKKKYFLGYYNTAKEAALAYDAAARYYHGEFAKTNFVGTVALSAEQIRDNRRLK